jgi:hypothetical protein
LPDVFAARFCDAAERFLVDEARFADFLELPARARLRGAASPPCGAIKHKAANNTRIIRISFLKNNYIFREKKAQAKIAPFARFRTDGCQASPLSLCIAGLPSQNGARGSPMSNPVAKPAPRESGPLKPRAAGYFPIPP